MNIFLKTTALALTISLISACGASDAGGTADPSSSAQGIEVDENLLTVDVTVPASFYEGQEITQAQLDADAKEKGYSKAKLNDDGSVSFTMSRAAYKQALAEMKKAVDDYIQETVNNQPEIFKEITYNDSMTKFEVAVDRAAFESDFTAGMIQLGIGILAGFYQAFADGASEAKIQIDYMDATSGEIFSTVNLPEDLN